MDELTSYHESGHAFVATILGGVVRQITIEPEADDRYGDTEVAWPMESCSPKEHAFREIKTLLAGPIVENIYADDVDVFAIKPEASGDWIRAMQLAGEVESDPKKQSLLLAQAASEIRQLTADDNAWAAIGALADELEAHETLEGEAVRDVLGFWLRR